MLNNCASTNKSSKSIFDVTTTTTTTIIIILILSAENVIRCRRYLRGFKTTENEMCIKGRRKSESARQEECP